MTKISFRLSIIFVIPFWTMAESEEIVSLHFEKAPIEQVIASLAAVKKLNFVVAPEVEELITVHLTEVDWSNALEMVKELAKVDITQKNNILIISPQQENLEPLEQRLGSQLPRSAVLHEKNFFLQFIDANEIERKLLALPIGGLSTLGKMAVDPVRQRITVWDDDKALQRITKWIAEQDVAQPQIEIAAQMISISQENLRELGISWLSNPSGNTQVPLAKNQFSTAFNVTTPAMTASVAIAATNSQLLFLELNALENENQIEIIASPRLVTSQGSTASIKQGTEIPYQTVTGKNDNPVIAFKEAVLGMQVTPERIGTQQIKLRLHLSQNFPGKVLQNDGKGPPSIDKQEISTEVIVMDGQTLALGGIFQQHQQKSMAGVPWLSQIPGLGVLFQHRMNQRQKRELVIFITPRLLLPRNILKIPLDEGSPLTSRAN